MTTNKLKIRGIYNNENKMTKTTERAVYNNNLYSYITD